MNTYRQFRSAVGNVVATISIPQTVTGDDIHPQSFDPLASYNWLDEHVPTIMVPGTDPSSNMI